MSAVVYLFPILAVVGMGLWYLNVYNKGKAVGGGIAEGYAQMQREKWAEVLSPGEEIKAWGSGVLWRPKWQYWLANQFKLLKLVWPMKVYQLLVTDRGRVLLATYTTFGGLADKQGHEKTTIVVSDVTEEPQSWLTKKINPMLGKSFVATFTFPDRALRLSAVPGDFLNALNA
jgi:hypothetical protein